MIRTIAVLREDAAWWLRHQPWAQWLARLWFAQHNAKVLVDMEWRMCLLVEEATGGRMSKAYYSIDQMRVEMAANHNAIYQNGWDDALADVSPNLPDDPELVA